MPPDARRLAGAATGCALIAGAIPFYPLYTLFFAAHGLADDEISALFILWSVVGLLAEVPCGALADRLSRRGALVAGGLLEAVAFSLWIAAPGFPAFAAGFVLWGLGSALESGSLEALLYDGLSAMGAQAQYSRLQSRLDALELFSQLPGAAVATGLFTIGGYPLVGWVSVGYCLAASAVAACLPETRAASGADEVDVGYLATLRAGIAEAVTLPAVRLAALALALLMGLDGLEEYFPLLAAGWGVPTQAVPFALLGIPVAGAVGAALGGTATRLPSSRLALLLGAGLVLLGAAALLGQPAGVAAVAAFYGIYRMVLVVADVRLQERISGPARATVTSVAALGSGLAVVVLFGAWAVGQLLLVAVLGLLVATGLPRWWRTPG